MLNATTVTNMGTMRGSVEPKQETNSEGRVANYE